MTVSPKVTISDVSSSILKRRNPSSSTIPTTKNPGTITTSVRIGSSPSPVAS